MPKYAIPTQPNGKVSGAHIKDLDRLSIFNSSQIFRSAIYNFSEHGFSFDVALFKNDHSLFNRLYVFFSGSADRSIFTMPVFHRWSWHSQFPGHCLYISDPTLKRSEELSLGWYIGDYNHDINLNIVKIIRSVAHNLSVAKESIVLYGSSGGGFAALRALSILNSSCAIVINPQTKLTSFVGNSLEKYLEAFFDGITKTEFQSRYIERNSIKAISQKIANSRIVYAQCIEDTHHVNHHLSELFSFNNGRWQSDFLKNSHLELFSDTRGHLHGEPNELVPKLLSLVHNEI